MNIFGNNTNSTSLADFKDPFIKDCVEKIFFIIRKDMWGKSLKYSATVYFQNGNTKGEQDIEAGNFVDLVKKVEDFVKSL